MTVTKQFIAVIVMAFVTYIPRVAPLVIFKHKIKSRFIRSFLSYVPYAVLGAMTFPSILYSTQHLYSAIAGLIIALVVAYFDKSLIKVAVSAILTVYIFELLI
ncbi:AzlD domain-containing protein [Vallitalea sp.]|jgi:branched-subunit amino acid transport protein|uniref:AzlD domain-containing protein n=1 Tax=Vallitalea sp. TaxID=1882829 RepID=UPI0025CCD9B5|nr:AzlD domain-containing protein [Vallitalea sp.]MCT4686895.1 AzlD domain-containing protein [Vallitalea sp.]